MPHSKKSNRALFIVIIAIIAFVLGLYFANHVFPTQKQAKAEALHGTLLNSPRKLSAFSLRDTNNHLFNNQRLQGHWTFLFFGFTQCSSICPTTMAELGRMYRELQETGVKTLPEVVMISLDPKRDDAETLAHYVRAFNPDFLGARGDLTTVKPLIKELGVAYAKIKLEGKADYDIEHTGTIFLVNPKGELIEFFTMPHQANLIKQDYLYLISVINQGVA